MWYNLDWETCLFSTIDIFLGQPTGPDTWNLQNSKQNRCMNNSRSNLWRFIALFTLRTDAARWRQTEQQYRKEKFKSSFNSDRFTNESGRRYSEQQEINLSKIPSHWVPHHHMSTWKAPYIFSSTCTFISCVKYICFEVITPALRSVKWTKTDFREEYSL